MGRDQSENGRRSILVADDDPHNVRVVGSLLKESGYQVHVADSGELALAIAGEVPLDLILLDIRMPRGMDGLKTCRRLKADDRTRPIPVIFLTGKEDEETTVRAFTAGGADYAKKPFDAQVLLARVRTQVELGLLSRTLERALAERTQELRDANARLRQLALEVSLIKERESQGFPPDAATRQPGVGGGYGLFSVRERLALLGGDLAIESDAAGTRVSLRAPLAASVNVASSLGEQREVRAS